MELASQIQVSISTDLDTWRPGKKTLNPVDLTSQSAANRRRKARRLRSRAKLGHPPTRQTIDSIVHTALPLYTDFTTVKLDHVKGAFTSKCQQPRTTKTLKQALADEMKRPRNVEELVSQGFQYIKWEGKSLYLIDSCNIVFAVIAAPPSKQDYASAAQQAYELAMRLSAKVTSSPHRRGDFPAINCGVHHGIGLQAPVNLKLRKSECDVLEELLGDPGFQRLCVFQSGKPTLIFSVF